MTPWGSCQVVNSIPENRSFLEGDAKEFREFGAAGRKPRRTVNGALSESPKAQNSRSTPWSAWLASDRAVWDSC
jgi:hypothetical protein